MRHDGGSTKQPAHQCAYFMYHGLCGGCGLTLMAKSILRHYVQEAFGVTLEDCIERMHSITDGHLPLRLLLSAPGSTATTRSKTARRNR